MRSMVADVDKIKFTLDVHDPERRTVVVGGGTVTLALAHAGIHPDEIKGLYDVDVLCDEQYFQSLATTPYTLRGIERFKIRWPKDRLLERGSTTLAIDLDPNTSMRQLGMVSFTACTSMSDYFYSMSYEKCHQEFETVYCGERSISIVEMLRWLSIIGREKDLETVEHILPVAANAGLVSNEQMASIQVEYDRSVNARGTQPQRYYSRNT